MSLVSTGALVLCLILKPSVDNNQSGEESKPQVQKVLGTVKEVFTKKVVKDSKDLRIALHDDKDMLVVETLDGEAEITIGAEACKRVVEKDEYESVKKKLKGLDSEIAPPTKNDKKTDTPEEVKQKPQTEEEKLQLLKLLDK
jgi:hypothetical protein